MARPRRRWYGDNGKFVVESLRHLMCMKMAKIYAKMYGRAFGTFLMHSKLGDIFTLRIVVARPVLRAEGTSVHIHVWDSTLSFVSNKYLCYCVSPRHDAVEGVAELPKFA